jgi:DMSO/TMAO reductase YedYZ molybdopterin-dependent catalytic subunit
MTTTPEAYVTIAGESSVRIPVPLPTDHGYETATVEGRFQCSSGELVAEGWTGLAVGALLIAADTPDDTTHVQVEGADGFTVCVPVETALDGVLAFGESEGPVASRPRFAGPGISGTRTVKGVRRICPVTLDPGEHPEAWEDLKLPAADE